MATMSSAAWIAHDVGLATSIGGAMFGRLALQPALGQVKNVHDRDHTAADAWRRFSWLNLAGHLAFAAPWFVGRRMLSGREVSPRACALTRVKDLLVGASLITGVTSIVLGRILGRRIRRASEMEHERPRKLARAVGVAGALNLVATAGVAAVTALLAMEAGKSMRFARKSRTLP
jgi:hypothetical protein